MALTRSGTRYIFVVIREDFRFLGLLLRSVAAAIAIELLAPFARPQVGPLLEGPGRTRPELPDFTPPASTPGNVLPPVRVPAEPDLKNLFTELRVLVREVRITGSTVIAGSGLDRIAAPYRGKRLSFADLEKLRDQPTLAYIERGYISSGAVIPDQTIRDGVVEIRFHLQPSLGQKRWSQKAGDGRFILEQQNPHSSQKSHSFVREHGAKGFVADPRLIHPS